MKVGDSVRKAIDDWEEMEFESAMLHACNAVDGTAAKEFSRMNSNERFTKLIRINYDIFGPMAMPGINLLDTRFPVTVKKPKAPGGKPDVADIIYGIHRCHHGHGDELPDGFQLIPDAGNNSEQTWMRISKGQVRLSDRTIFGLLAVAITSEVNSGQEIPSEYHLTFNRVYKFFIHEWWGRREDFKSILTSVQLPSVKLDFGAWMDD